MVTGTWRGEPCEAVQALAIDRFEDIIEEFGPTEYDVDPFSIKILEPWKVTVYDMWWLLRSGDDVIAVSNVRIDHEKAMLHLLSIYASQA